MLFLQMCSCKLFSSIRIVVFSFITLSLCLPTYANTQIDQVSGHWLNSDQLKPGMKIITADNQVLTVSQEWQQHPDKETTYNFEVKKNHTYFVGEPKLWAHNETVCDTRWVEGTPNGRWLAMNDAKYSEATNLLTQNKIKVSKRMLSEKGDAILFGKDGKQLVVVYESDSGVSLIEHMESIRGIAKRSGVNSAQIAFADSIAADSAIWGIIESSLQYYGYNATLATGIGSANQTKVILINF